MALVQEIITDAYRETNLFGLGEQPDAAQTDEALRALNRIVASVFGNEVGESLIDYTIGSDYGYDQGEYLEPDTRLVIATPTTRSFKLNPYPADGDRLQLVDAGAGFAANPVTIMRQASKFDGNAADFVANTDDFNQMWMYRADLADWVRVLPLATTDQFPFPERHDDAFIGMLATRLNPKYQQALSAESRASLTRSLIQLRAAYSRSKRIDADLAVTRLTGSGYSRGGGGPVSTQRFLNGLS